MARAYTEEEFRAKCAELYGDKFTLKSLAKLPGSRKIRMNCTVHGEVLCDKARVVAGTGCPQCGYERKGRARDTLEEFVEKARAIHGENYKYSRLEDAEVVFECPIHGEQKHLRNDHLHGHGCPPCGHAVKNDGRRDTLQTYEVKARLKHGDKFIYHYIEGKYINYSCPIHGEIKQEKSSHLQGAGCEKCNKRKSRLSFDEIVTRSKEVHGERYFYKELNQSFLLYTCEKHGDTIQKYADHIKGHGCVQCGIESASIKKALTMEEFLERVAQNENLVNAGLEYLEVDERNVMFKCSKHGIQVRLKGVHLVSLGCPECKGVQISRFSEKVAAWLDSLQITYIQESNLPYKGTTKKADFIVGNLVLELNGNYWHTEDKVGVSCHIDKLRQANEAGYDFLMFSDVEWDTKPEVIKGSILRRIGLDNVKGIGARSLTVKEPSAIEVRALLDKYHIQGFAGAGNWYGLYNKTELIAVAGFSMKTTGRGTRASLTEGELVRFCASRSVAGAGSKLIAHAHKVLGFTRLSTFSDDRFFSGSVYKACGFTAERKIAPSYCYTKSGIIINKASLQKSAFANNTKLLYDPSLTERELAELNGFKRIYDAGKTLWVKTYK